MTLLHAHLGCKDAHCIKTVTDLTTFSNDYNFVYGIQVISKSMVPKPKSDLQILDPQYFLIVS